MKNMTTKNLLILLGVVLVIAIGAFAISQKSGRPAATDTPPAETASVEQPVATVPDSTVTTDNAATPEAPAPKSASTLSYDNASLPAEPIGERTLGNPTAPVRIEEFSSLTCPHCAHFHRDTLPALKEKYIDSGKVFFVFTDFPLNGPALDAAMIARCMPPERYFTFIGFLYENQDSWAFAPDYQAVLRQNAKLAGMSDERFDSCLADTALKEGLVARMQDKATKHQIKSTPSFIINDKHVTSGALPIEAFDEMIAKAETEGAAGKEE